MELVITAAESDGELHEMRVTYAAGAPFPPPHLHRAQDERFEVHEGVLLFLVDGHEHIVRAGESIDIPRRSVHQARNPGDVPATVTWQVRPALLGVVEEFADVFELAEQPTH
jgi:mannose-6-phosphate isomerase-like protein (cupin superfamily)